MKHILTLLLTITLVSCSKDEREDIPLSAKKAQTLIDISYGSNANQKMDAYLPANRSTEGTKVMVLIHGGAWIEGDKTDFNANIEQFKNVFPGYAIFNVNYRLFDFVRNAFPAQEQDIKSAVEFIFNKRSDFFISDKFVLVGVSAGAHLAQLQAYKNNSVVKPKAIVSFFGPADMEALYNYYYSTNRQMAYGLNLLLGGTPANRSQLYYDSSPINFVSAQSPPTIILQGGLDNVVPKQQSYSLEARLKNFNVKSELIFYPNEEHGWDGPELTESLQKIVTFLKTNVP
ncbi:alpha/beta hydrolase [Niabella ginsengisoli]|uniref:Alpha/beta hydrolase n=1 Tax=Niabella ginsengisoli TaxID=522298 RepID=A0ABS9SFW2_9BACT|nr:alpha/beta hydrolase [Niabella ginsengisoli]MCH5597248.1 alpha/beta hydrolase [Niabella ginsengisoli]